MIRNNRSFQYLFIADFLCNFNIYTFAIELGRTYSQKKRRETGATPSSSGEDDGQQFRTVVSNRAARSCSGDEQGRGRAESRPRSREQRRREGPAAPRRREE